ncbi:ShlB/FhaC/HecB family hemolysin secretion/activation protein [Vibrio sp. NTOU-M3]|uniref:ShlB/FhaC/HecB family hemolysin secretion/activation protein n=1 Tax=Vibrio sp. NTOU-M3 TaxID=3234954 RepID=UPI0035A82DEF
MFFFLPFGFATANTHILGPLATQDIEREQAQRLEQIEQNKQSVKELTPNITLDRPIEEFPEQCFNVRELVFSGNTIYSDEELAQAIHFQPTCLGLAEINEYLRVISNLYMQAGYVTSRAFLVPQDLSSGRLEIVILEGELEQLLLNGEESSALKLAFPFMVGSILNLRDIEQGLDQINRLSRYNAQIKLLPGTEQGKSTVDIRTHEDLFMTLSTGINNGGQKSTGEEQLSLNLGLENVLRILDKWTFSATKSALIRDSKDSESLFMSVDVPIGYWNIGYRTSYSTYKTTFTSNSFQFDSSGKTNSHDADLKWLFHRDSVSKSSFKLGLHHRREKNFILGALLESGSRNLSSSSLSLDHSTRLGNGFFTLSPRFVAGTDWFGGKEDEDDAGAAPKAQFYKGTLTASYTYPFSNALSLSSTLFGQWSNQTLYGSERLSIGGEYSVRGFKGKSISGDEGYYWRNDLNYQIAKWPVLGNISATLALDTGTIAKDKVDAFEEGSLTGTSLSIKTRSENISSSLSVGFPIDAPERLNADDYVLYYRLDLAI